MDKATRLARLQARYGGARQEGPQRREFGMPGPGGRGRNQAMGASGRPKNLRRTVARLLRVLSRERLLLALAMACAVACTLSTLAAGYMLRPIMNRFLYYDPAEADLSGRIAALGGGLAVMAAVYAVSVSTQYAQQRLMLTVSQRSLRRMRQALFDKLQTLPVRYFDTHAAGDVMSRFTNAVDSVGEMLNTTLIQIISGAITLVGTIALMLYTSPILGSITLVMTPVLTLISKRIISRGRGAYVRQQRNLGMLNGFSEEIISGQKVVKVFSHEEIALDEFDLLNE